MPSRRDYNDEFRASAVLMLEAAGYPIKKGALQDVARHLGVPERTVSRWFKEENNPPPTKLVSKKRMDLKDMVQTELHAIFTAMETVREEATYKDLGTVAGILADKLAILQGDVSSRDELRIVIKRDDENPRNNPI